MLRKNLRGPEDLDYMPSMLGSVFRVALNENGTDSFDYVRLTQSPGPDGNTIRLGAWNACRDRFGLQWTPEDRGPYSTPNDRQQYVS
jgi:hypothetical protein